MRRDLVSLRPAVVSFCDDPMQLFIDPRDVREAREGETLADMLGNRPGGWVCMVDERFIPQEAWHYMPPPASFVQFRAVGNGGGDDKGSSRAILQIIAIIAINYFTYGLGNGFYASLFRVGLSIAATALINNLVPLGQQKSGSSFTGRAENNQARLGQPIPEVFGFSNTFPDIAAQPYNLYPVRPISGALAEFAENYFDFNVGNRINTTQQVLFVVLCLGEGQHHICRVSNGDTDLRNYDDVEIVRVGPGQSTMDGPGTGVENMADQTLVDPRWVTNQDASLVEMRPGNPAGPFTVCGREKVVDRIGIDLIQSRGMTQEVRMRWRHEAQLIDDFEQPLGPWIDLGSHTTTRQASGPQYIITGDINMPVGRYWVRCIRTDETDESNLDSIDQLSVLAVRGRVVDADINVSNCTFICIAVRVTGQINGSLRFRVMHYRMLPVWDGSAWSAPQITRNPAWSFAHVARSRGVPDERLDLPQLLSLAPVWDSRYDSFDFRFATQVSMWDAMAMITKVGRAIPLVRGSRYTVVRDAPQTLPVAHYGMRNIVRGTVTMKPALAQTGRMRTLDLEYDDHRHNSPITVTAQIHNRTVYGYRGDLQRIALGLPEPDQNTRGRVSFPGIIGENHALRTVTYTLADRYYRPIDVEYETELDGELPALLNLVVFQHELGNFGQGGDLVTWDEGTLTVTTTEPLRWSDGTHAMRLQYQTGAMTDAIPVTRGADDYTAVLSFEPPPVPDTAIDFEFRTDDADRERTKYVFGPTQQVGALAKVMAMIPRKQRMIGMRLVLEDDRVHSVDAQWIAPDSLPECYVAPEPRGRFYIWNGLSNPTISLDSWPNYGGGTPAYEEGDLLVVMLVVPYYLSGLGNVYDDDFLTVPEGWTLERFADVPLTDGYYVAVMSSYYSNTNAVVSRASFPFYAGFYMAGRYPGGTLVQINPITVTPLGGQVSVVLPSLDNPPGENSTLVAMVGARDNPSGNWSSNDGMVHSIGGGPAGEGTLGGLGFTYFSAAIFEQNGSISGERTFEKLHGQYTSFGLMFEVSFN